MTFHKSKDNTMLVCEPVWLFVHCTELCYPWGSSRYIANDTHVPENSGKLLKTPIYLFLCFGFFHFFFYQSYFPCVFSSFPCRSCGLYSLHAITPLFTLYLSIFCHIVSLLKLHIFCSHLPHRAISSYSWQSCIAECFWSWANFKLAISSIK